MELQSAGESRALALEQADQQLERIALRLPEALAAGLSITEIARTSGVSRQTLYELKARHGNVGDVRLAALQTVLMYSPITTEKIAEQLQRSEAEIGPLVTAFFHEELIDLDTSRRSVESGEVEPGWRGTPLGLEALERWTFEQGADPR